MSSFRYCLRDALLSIGRRFGLHLLTFLTLLTVFFLLGAVLVLVVAFQSLTLQVEEGLTVSVYLKEGSFDLKALREQVASIPGVREVEPVPKEEALRELQRALGGRRDFLEILGSRNPLPDALRVKVNSVEDVEGVVKALSSRPEVDEVVHAGALVERLSRVKRAVALGGVAFAGVAFLASVLLVFNAVKVSVYSRQEEIAVMLLVGATYGYIKAPFLIEGILVCGSSALAASSLLWLFFDRLFAKASALLPFVRFPHGLELAGQIFLVVVGFGLLVGMISSWAAVSGYLNFKARPR